MLDDLYLQFKQKNGWTEDISAVKLDLQSYCGHLRGKLLKLQIMDLADSLELVKLGW